MGIASVARLGGKSGPIWQHWRRRHLTILSSFISECYKSHFVGVCCPPGSHGSHVTAKYEFTTRIPSKLAYIRHSDQKLMHSQQLFQNSSKARMPKSHFELTRDWLQPATINCKLKQPTTWVQKTQKTSPQHQQILSNKYCVLHLFMWQWFADASRGVAYHIHLVQQVILLIVSMVLVTCSGAFYQCIQAKMTWCLIIPAKEYWYY